jgi:hypothetical protein
LRQYIAALLSRDVRDNASIEKLDQLSNLNQLAGKIHQEEWLRTIN